MKHRLSAGALVEHEGKLLLVRHKKEAQYDFWVAPGGGVQSTEELVHAAQREVREETGLSVEIGQMLYVEEFHNPDVRHCKFWFAGKLIGGKLSTSAPEATSEYIVEAAWHSRDQVASLEVFPSVLRGR
jgi:8-oxo-dGTP diphosphatase